MERGGLAQWRSTETQPARSLGQDERGVASVSGGLSEEPVRAAQGVSKRFNAAANAVALWRWNPSMYLGRHHGHPPALRGAPGGSAAGKVRPLLSNTLVYVLVVCWNVQSAFPARHRRKQLERRCWGESYRGNAYLPVVGLPTCCNSVNTEPLVKRQQTYMGELPNGSAQVEWSSSTQPMGCCM